VVKAFNGFLQACWEVLKVDIMNVFHEFHARGTFGKSLNVTFISFILKKPRAVDIKGFRLISLVGGVYKIVAKVLAYRLKIVVEKIISKPHDTFIKGRQILDSILIANEAMSALIVGLDLRNWVYCASWILKRLMTMSIGTSFCIC